MSVSHPCCTSCMTNRDIDASADLEGAVYRADTVMKRVAPMFGFSTEGELERWIAETPEAVVRDLADVVWAMSEYVRRTRIDCGRLRSSDVESVDGNTVDSTSPHWLPLNRKERYYTGTVLPMLIGSDRFSQLHRFLALCGLVVEPFGRDDDGGGPGIQFFTEYNLFESIFTKEDRARFEADPPTERDTPDLVLVGSDWLLVVEAKMFHKPNPATMTEQLRRQRTIVKYLADALPHIPADRVAHVLLVPGGLDTTGVPGKILRWEDVRDAYRFVGPLYWHDVLADALARYTDLVSKGPLFHQNMQAMMTGQEIVTAHAEGNDDYQYMGRKRGLDGAELAEDIKSGNWRTQRYEVSDIHPSSGNWFTVAEFIQKTAAS